MTDPSVFSSVTNIMSLQKHDSNLEERKQLSLTAIRYGRTKVQEEIAEFRAKLQLAKDTITQFKGEIGKVRTRQWSEFWERVSIQVDVTFAGSTISGASTGGRLRQSI